MKKVIYLSTCATLLLLNSCGESVQTLEANTADTSNSIPPPPEVGAPPAVVSKPENTNTPESAVMLGTWEGSMNGKTLKVVIEKVEGTTLEGYNILGTNRRPLKGTFTVGSWDQPCSKAFEATLAEPGDDKWDGVFTIKFVGYEDDKETDNGPECAGNLKGVEANGEWKSNNGKLNHTLDLTRSK